MEYMMQGVSSGVMTYGPGCRMWVKENAYIGYGVSPQGCHRAVLGVPSALCGGSGGVMVRVCGSGV